MHNVTLICRVLVCCLYSKISVRHFVLRIQRNAKIGLILGRDVNLTVMCGIELYLASSCLIRRCSTYWMILPCAPLCKFLRIHQRAECLHNLDAQFEGIILGACIPASTCYIWTYVRPQARSKNEIYNWDVQAEIDECRAKFVIASSDYCPQLYDIDKYMLYHGNQDTFAQINSTFLHSLPKCNTFIDSHILKKFL